MILECSAFTLNKYVVIGFKPITEMKGCVPSDLRCEMIVMALDRVSGHNNYAPSILSKKCKREQISKSFFYFFQQKNTSN